MDGLTTTCTAGACFLPPPSYTSSRKPTNNLSFPFSFSFSSSSHRRSFRAFSSSGDVPSSGLDELDNMELKFAKLLGEDPELALAKVGAKRGGLGATLRKSEMLQGDVTEMENLSRLKAKPKLFLAMRKGNGSENQSSDVNLLKKPEIARISLRSSSENKVSSAGNGLLEEVHQEFSAMSKVTGSEMGVKDMVETGAEGPSESDNGFVPESSLLGDGIEHNGLEPCEDESSTFNSLVKNTVKDRDYISTLASLQGNPSRLDSLAKKISYPVDEKTFTPNHGIPKATAEKLLELQEQEEHEEGEWRRAEDLLLTGERVQVELISGSSRGFVVSFGSLIGILPYKNLGSKWKFLAFESWLRKKGLNPSLYRGKLGIVGNYVVQHKNISPVSNNNQDLDKKDEDGLERERKFEDLVEMYDKEKAKFLSSFVGQRTRVIIIMVDRKSRRLTFSERCKEKEDVIDKKRCLMAKLHVGDIVKCCIKKITYYGIFVEIEGVSALIHQSQVSWDVALNPLSFFKIGQMVDAKVHQLDYALERIALSLQEITPDPMNESLESDIDERAPLAMSIKASEGNFECPDVESLIKELEQIDGVIAVTKGRFFLNPDLAPTFQVHMASTYESRYKLLARFENKVQEVIVHASLDKDQMTAAILTCTSSIM